ncbi:hypothetical protein A2699_06580 [Candidatus Gottesmanbacteria bacterium RIFCSPHIGHO2_01_FULL_43_15]|nr:MAG: hypothetical protein A2699_06580 [Candidatus Gottesmanbacteria bacterium RIFCSPHIGHO2_01_FULL_43_15]
MHILADKTRAKILASLAQTSPQTAGQIVAQFHLRQPTISHHLQVLRDADFIRSQKKSNQVYYSINLNCHKNPQAKCLLLQPSTQLPL